MVSVLGSCGRTLKELAVIPRPAGSTTYFLYRQLVAFLLTEKVEHYYRAWRPECAKRLLPAPGSELVRICCHRIKRSRRWSATK